MEKMNNLRDLLRHELEDLRSAEDQITAALPRMIENAKNPQLKQSLQEHLRVTEQQLRRLDRIDEIVKKNGGGGEGGESKGFLSGLFGGGAHKCRGMEGILVEGEKIMKEDMDGDVKDAAIIASCQKVEHYEICGYGTARAFARELQLTEVERLLTETLNEEYQADELLTALAVVGGLNEEAMDRRNRASSSGRGNSGGGRSQAGGNGSSRSGSNSSGGRSSGGSKSASKSSGGGRSAGKSSGGSKSASKGGAKSATRGGSKSSGGSKGASKGGSKSAGKSSGGGKSASKGGGRSKGASKGGKKSASKGRR